MPRRGDNIRKRKDGRWEARYIKDDYTDPARKYGSVYGKTYQEAKEKRDLIIRYGQQRPQVGGVMFKDILEAWQASNRVRLKEASISRYQNLIDSHILPELGTKRMGQLSATVINRFLATKLEKGRLDGKGGLSASYVRSITLIIESAINYGVAEHLCSPLHSVITKPSLPKTELSILGKERQSQLEQYLLKEINEEKLLIYLTLYTGLRIGEACALRWEDINLDSKLIYIRQQFRACGVHRMARNTLSLLSDIQKQKPPCAAYRSAQNCMLSSVPSPAKESADTFSPVLIMIVLLAREHLNTAIRR